MSKRKKNQEDIKTVHKRVCFDKKKDKELEIPNNDTIKSEEDAIKNIIVTKQLFGPGINMKKITEYDIIYNDDKNKLCCTDLEDMIFTLIPKYTSKTVYINALIYNLEKSLQKINIIRDDEYIELYPNNNIKVMENNRTILFDELKKNFKFKEMYEKILKNSIIIVKKI